jgi:hypothetical protein
MISTASGREAFRRGVCANGKLVTSVLCLTLSERLGRLPKVRCAALNNASALNSIITAGSGLVRVVPEVSTQVLRLTSGTRRNMLLPVRVTSIKPPLTAVDSAREYTHGQPEPRVTVELFWQGSVVRVTVQCSTVPCHLWY